MRQGMRIAVKYGMQIQSDALFYSRVGEQASHDKDARLEHGMIDVIANAGRSTQIGYVTLVKLLSSLS